MSSPEKSWQGHLNLKRMTGLMNGLRKKARHTLEATAPVCMACVLSCLPAQAWALLSRDYDVRRCV
jgi:hypothetical protein